MTEEEMLERIAFLEGEVMRLEIKAHNLEEDLCASGELVSILEDEVQSLKEKLKAYGK